MLIGQLADTLGIPTRTVRFYERKGLLPDPERAENGYRVSTTPRSPGCGSSAPRKQPD